MKEKMDGIAKSRKRVDGTVVLEASCVPSTVHPTTLGTPLAGPGCSLHLNSPGGSKPTDLSHEDVPGRSGGLETEL